MPTALVTGAAGFLGRALVRALAARGVAVRALLRPSSDASALPPGVEVVRGDALDRAAVRRAVDGCELVYHLAGLRRAADRDSFFAVNAGSTRLLLDACLEGGAARGRFVLAGSLAAAGPSREGKREEDPLAPVEWYGESKAEAERIALSYAGRLPVAVARPPRILGPGDRENLLFFRLAAKGLVLRVLGPERPLSWIDVDDCARGFALLGERPEAVGQVFFLASPERTSVEGLQREVARALGVAPRTVPVPPAALSALGWAADAVTRLTGRRLPLNRKLVRQVLAPGWTCATGKAERVLGFTAGTALRDSVARSARDYRERGWLPGP
ncbi:NAD-dependent epimerase/dehydratase family protein [Anaeromyxobacter diazotrophicus]|uniref:Epimerase n=1 Tax=Anaeromyxobacter diazotrophicus TaxID=2590199 RepID=A0A7I9VN73_9BACT|nr:NAD-dependent epimerase/dehydratase family protein [Anaeromyxobacter diazotrophicus]GEJ57855.1 epimerase [Anaeromyxobacter diazotrophicus]